MTARSLLEQLSDLENRQVSASQGYALIDGGLYTRTRGPASMLADEWPDTAILPLFRYAFDKDYPALSPYLVRLGEVDGLRAQRAVRLSADYGVVSWLWSSLSLEELARRLAAFLDARLPGGERIVLRLFDPRQLTNTMNCLDQAHQAQLFRSIEAWAYLDSGGKRAADESESVELKTLALAENRHSLSATELKLPLQLTRDEARRLMRLADEIALGNYLKEHEPTVIEGMKHAECLAFCERQMVLAQELSSDSLRDCAVIARLSRAHGPQWHVASVIAPLLVRVRTGAASLAELEVEIAVALTS